MRWLPWRKVGAAVRTCGWSFHGRHCYHDLRVFLIAGEPSGDVIGSRLMASLSAAHPFDVKFSGIGGPLMERQGMISEFSMDDLSVMGAIELIPHLIKLRVRIQQTVAAMETFQPDVIVAIDSKGFCFHVLKSFKAKRLKQQQKIPLSILYVAPSVWAWKGGERQLQKWIGVVDHILCILPFEKPICEANGLSATFVGHPVLEDAFFDPHKSSSWTSNWHIKEDKKIFFSEHHLPEGTTLLSLLPGSRLQEVKRMMRIYRDAIEMLSVDVPNLTVTIPTTFSRELIQRIKSETNKWKIPVLLLPGATLKQKYEAFNASSVGLCTSGTIVLQMQLARLPCVAAYRANLITEWLIKRSIQLKYMSLPNILLNAPVIPEAAFSRCTAYRLAELLRSVLADHASQQKQIFAAEKVLQMLAPTEVDTVHGCQSEKKVMKPSMVAAKTIISMLGLK